MIDTYARPFQSTWISLLLCSALTLAFFSLTQLGASAQEQSLVAAPTDRSTAIIIGFVHDAVSNAPIADATVQFKSMAGTITTQSDTGGKFEAHVPGGTYTVTASARNFKLTVQQFTVAASQSINMDVSMASTQALKTIGHVGVSTGAGTINATPAAITSISPSDILAQGGIGMGRVLSEIPGIQVQVAQPGRADPTYQTGAVNSPATPVVIGIRGSEPYENTTLFDGHPIGTAYYYAAYDQGDYNYAALDPYSFSSLDAIRGPGAAAPTINNSIGGVVNIDPGVPSGPMHVNLAYGIDGLGGGNFHLGFSGDVSKWLGIGFSASSTTTPGRMVSDFNYVDAGGPLGYGTSMLDGQPFSCYLGVTCYPNGYPGPVSPHIAGSPYGRYQTSAILCCVSGTDNPYADWTNNQERSVNLRINLSSSFQIRLRYSLANLVSFYNPPPCPETFIAPAGYTGSVPSNTNFQSGLRGFQSNELDQIFEYDIRTRVGKGALRWSYASDRSVNDTYCIPFLKGTYRYYGTAFLNGSNTPTIFNGTSVTFASLFSENVSTVDTNLIHDFIGEYSYPIGSSVVGISYNRTSYQEPNSYAEFCDLPPNPPFRTTGGSDFGEIAYYNTWHARVDTQISSKLQSQVSLYLNQYQYHLVDPAQNSPNVFVDTRSSYNSPRFSFVYRPASDIAVRASAGGGIAPLDNIHLASQNTGIFPNNPSAPTFYTQYISNPNLQPETSFGEDVGLSYRLHDRVSLISIDLYNTQLHNQFFTNESPHGTYLGLPLFITQNRNLGQSRYQGIEFDYERSPISGLTGSFQGSLQRAYTYNLPAGFYNTALGGPYSTNLSVIPNVNFNGASSLTSVPYASAFGSVGWKWLRGSSVALNATYYGNNNGFYRPAFVVFDMDASVLLIKGAALQLAFTNLNNIYSSRFYNRYDFVTTPYIHADLSDGFIGLAQGVQNVGPRALSATLNLKL